MIPKMKVVILNTVSIFMAIRQIDKDFLKEIKYKGYKNTQGFIGHKFGVCIKCKKTFRLKDLFSVCKDCFSRLFPKTP